jgi:hypothetical protein
VFLPINDLPHSVAIRAIFVARSRCLFFGCLPDLRLFVRPDSFFRLVGRKPSMPSRAVADGQDGRLESAMRVERAGDLSELRDLFD